MDYSEGILEEMNGRMDQLRAECRDYDPDDKEITCATVELARSLAERIFRGCSTKRLSWSKPGIGSDPNGRVCLTFRPAMGVRQYALLMVDGEEPDSTVVVTGVGDGEPRREALSQDEAVQRALWALSLQHT